MVSRVVVSRVKFVNLEGAVADDLFLMGCSRSLVWLGLVVTSCSQGWALLNSESQDLNYNFPTPENSERLPPLDSPPLDGIVRSLLNEPYEDLSPSGEDRSPVYPTRGNIRKSFSLLTTTTQRTTPHFEALSRERDEPQKTRAKTYFINNEKVEVENSQELIDKFKTLIRGHATRSTTRSPYERRTYEEKLEENASLTPLDSSGPNANLQPLPIRHWSTESNVIREGELQGSSYPYSYVTPRPSTPRPYQYRGNAKYTNPTTERITSPTYKESFETTRNGKYIPTHLFSPNYDRRNAYIAPTTYRPPFNGQGAYSFSFRSQNHSRQESGDTKGNFRGSVKYMDTFGIKKQIDYEGNPEKGFVTSEMPYVSIGGRTGQRYIPTVTTPGPFTPSGLTYSYSYRADDPLGSSTVSYDDYRKLKDYGYSSTESPLNGYSNPTRATPDGSYLFSYNAGDHQRQEVRDRNGNVRGMYSFEGTDGEKKLVQYEANPDSGFVAQGSHIPFEQGRIPPEQVQQQYGDQPPPGQYYFSYDAGDHSRQEVRDDAGNVQGSYSFITADGATRTVNYKASPEEGFVVSGVHIPPQTDIGYSI